MCLPGWVGRAIVHVERVETPTSVELVETPARGFDKLNQPGFDKLNQPTLNQPGFDRLQPHTLTELTPIKETITR